MTTSSLWSQAGTCKPLYQNQVWILSSTWRPLELREADLFSLTIDIISTLSGPGLLSLLSREVVVKLSSWNPVSGIVICGSALSVTRKTEREKHTHTHTHTHTQYLKTTNSNVTAISFSPAWTNVTSPSPFTMGGNIILLGWMGYYFAHFFLLMRRHQSRKQCGWPQQ